MVAKWRGNPETGGKTTGIAVAGIEGAIHVIRGVAVMLDEDLARLYGTPTKRMNEQVARNLDRFPRDFAFRLTAEEFRNLKSQFATSSWGGRRKPPRAFTEHGAVMLSSVLRTQVAAQASVLVVRAFVRMRRHMLDHHELAGKLAELEREVGRHDKEIRAVFEAIRRLLEPKRLKCRSKIGFRR